MKHAKMTILIIPALLAACGGGTPIHDEIEQAQQSQPAPTIGAAAVQLSPSAATIGAQRTASNGRIFMRVRKERPRPGFL